MWGLLEGERETGMGALAIGRSSVRETGMVALRSSVRETGMVALAIGRGFLWHSRCTVVK